MSKLSLIIPSNNPDSYFNYFHKTISYLYPLNNFHDVTFCFVLQTPWRGGTFKMVKKDLEYQGFKVKVAFLSAKKYPSMNRIRKVGMVMSKNDDYFLMADDNFQFGITKDGFLSGLKYHHCIDYLEKHKDCGFVMCEGYLGGNIQKHDICSTKTGMFWTCRGLLIRNIGIQNIMPKSLCKIKGGLEESVITYHIIENGYYPAKQFYNPTLHKDTHKLEVGAESTIHDYSLIRKGNQKYIQDRYLAPLWDYQKRKLPKRLISAYLENGGKLELLNSNQRREKYGNQNNKHRGGH